MAIETSFTIKQLNADEALKQAEEKAKKTSDQIDKSLSGKKVKVNTKDIEKAQKSATGLGEKLSGAFNTFLGMAGWSGVSGTIGKIKDWLIGLVTSTDMLSKSARNLGISGEDLQNLQYAARSAGMEVDVLPAAFARMKKAAGNALNGDQGAIEQFQRLGISVKDLSGKKPWEIFEMVAESLNSIQNPVEKSAAGMEIFGKSFDKMQNFLRDYKGSVDYLKDKGIITEDHLQAAEKLTQRIEDLKTSLNALAVNSGFIEEIYQVVDGLAKWNDEIRKMESFQKSPGVTSAPAENRNKTVWRMILNGFSGLGNWMFGTGYTGDALFGTRADTETVSYDPKNDPEYQRKLSEAWKKRGLTGMTVKQQAQEYAKQREEERARVMDEYRQNQIKKISGSTIESETNKQKSLDETAKKMKDDSAYEKLKTVVEQIDFKQRQVTEEQTKQAEIQKKINELKEKSYASGEEVKRAEDLASISKFETEIKESKNEQLKIELEIDALRRKSTEYYRDAKDKLDAELAVQKKINEGKFEEAERQKIINDLKAKGLTVNEKEIDAMMKRKKELAAIRFDDSMKQSGYDLLYQQQKKSNYRQAEYDKRVRDKERELGGPLNDAQKSKIYDMLDIEIKMNMEPKLDFRNTDIKTNDLTARGGFSTGAVVVPKDRINEQIRGYAARQVSLLSQIKALLGQEGII